MQLHDNGNGEKSTVFPHGVLILTLVYTTFTLIVENGVRGDCIHEPCNSEGIDNTTSGWATDFFIGVTMFGLCAHLERLRSANNILVRRSGVLGIAFMGFGYIFGGSAHLLFFNSGAGDGRAHPGFFVTWILSFVGLTGSACFHTYFVHQVWADIKPESSKTSSPIKGTIGIKFILAMLVVAFFGITLGCLWCLVQPEIHTSQLIDTFDGVDQTPTCTALITYFEGSWYILYASLWIPGGVLLSRCVASVDVSSVWGLSTRWAALSLPIIQWTIGFMYLIWVYIYATMTGRNLGAVYTSAEGPVVYHFGVLLTMFAVHSMTCVYLEHSGAKTKPQLGGVEYAVGESHV